MDEKQAQQEAESFRKQGAPYPVSEIEDAVRNAYRLGAVETLLASIATGEVEVAGIFAASLEGERSYRLAALSKWGNVEEVLKEARVPVL